MNREECERICLAMMAIADGEQPPSPVPEIEAHLAGCESCRTEVAGMKMLIDELNAQQRREGAESVWPGIAETLKRGHEAGTRADHWPWLLLLGLLLAGYRLIVSTSAWDPGHWFKIVPILLAVTFFIFLRENPFKVSPILQTRDSLRGNS